MFHTKGTVKTAHAAKYLQQLCKHFAHKVEVSYSTTGADVAFPMGPCKMRATDDELQFHASALKTEGIERIKGIIINHLDRFAWRETIAYDWQDFNDAD
ncbi:DUF2218 domain-containing protein [Thalassospira marina]|uniref:2,4-dihydroxyhept-2-ene-1,7-dioic acid aldolase n=1 Tax=Thalassospira marina TaxID=2048283 RepID=A0A2N3KXF7_9PROT|nr:DUF2218 domain-containing protein [Thalassospira marina]PKR55218.1 2,4-dihydroxyhept-2-ene-1,7-dioic acid aldolase [Thalassospira marina]